MLKQIFFLPHGMQIIPGVEPVEPDLFVALHNKMEEITSKLVEEITHLILVTPHGYSLEDKFVVYYHDWFVGDIYEISADSVVHGTPIGHLSFQGDLDFTNALCEGITSLDPQQLVHGAPSYPMTLNWGASVPLYYFRERNELKISIIGIPRNRHTDLDGLCNQIGDLAEAILAFTGTRDEEIGLIISGDLSHVHQADGPYGYHDNGPKFDHLVQRWFEHTRKDLLQQIIELQPTALACGMAGLILIHEILKKQKYRYIASYYEVPTYFGMGLALWEEDYN